MIKKFLAILFILSIVLTNKAHERWKKDFRVYAMCGNGGNPVPMFVIFND